MFDRLPAVRNLRGPPCGPTTSCACFRLEQRNLLPANMMRRVRLPHHHAPSVNMRQPLCYLSTPQEPRARCGITGWDCGCGCPPAACRASWADCLPAISTRGPHGADHLVGAFSADAPHAGSFQNVRTNVGATSIWGECRFTHPVLLRLCVIHACGVRVCQNKRAVDLVCVITVWLRCQAVWWQFSVVSMPRPLRYPKKSQIADKKDMV